MGKNRVIQIISGLIAGMVAHKTLEKYTNREESINHLRAEVDNYRNNLSEFIQEYNWNSHDKEKMKTQAFRCFKLEIKKPHFNDVKFPLSEAEKLIEKTLDEMFPNNLSTFLHQL